MLWLIAGAAALFLLLGGLRAFERASISSIKSLLAWVAALGGLTLALLLVLSGRGGLALGALVMFGPLIWRKWSESRARAPRAGPGSSGAGSRWSSGGSRQGAATMSREEAYQVLGLAPGASEAQIRDAHRRLMRAAHPDSGGSDWLASRINQARDVLL